MLKSLTKQETELRVAHAAKLIAEGKAYSSIITHVAAKYGMSRITVRKITSNAYLLLKDDIEKGGLNRPEMTTKLLCTLETAMHRAIQEKEYSTFASNAKVLMKLIGLGANIKNGIEFAGDGFRNSAYISFNHLTNLLERNSKNKDLRWRKKIYE